MAPDVVDNRSVSVRDRRGRGARGPLLGTSVPARIGRGERFDLQALAVLAAIEQRWPGDLDHVELAVEEVPVLPAGWAGDSMPLGALQPLPGAKARLVVFRRPIERRTDNAYDRQALLLRVLCEHLAPVLGVMPEHVHPDYR